VVVWVVLYDAEIHRSKMKMSSGAEMMKTGTEMMGELKGGERW
jgi:hypothetical protein